MDLSCKTPLLQYDEDDVNAILKKHGKTLKMLEDDVRDVRKWAQKGHIPLVPCDRKIACLLILTDFSLERTKQALEMSFALKSFMPEFFIMLPNNQKFIHFARAHNLFLLPKLTKDRKRIFVSQAVHPERFDVDEYITVIFQICEMSAIHDFNNGMEYIIDYGLFDENVLKRLTLPKLQKLYLFLEKVYSKKILPIHNINLSEEAMEFINVGKSILLKPEDPLFAHSKKEGFEVLHEFYSKDVLPKDYGGDLKTLAEYREEWIKYLQENNDYFEEIQYNKIHETDRINDIKIKEFPQFRKNIEV